MVCVFWCCFWKGKGHKMTKLTKRQTQVLELILMGKKTAQIALEMGISSPTVKVHIRKLLKAREVSTKLELVLKEYNKLKKIIEKIEG